jgi:hypothetical protein
VAQESSAEVSRTAPEVSPGDPRDGAAPTPHDLAGGKDAGGKDRNLQRAPRVSHPGSRVFRGSLPDSAGSVPQTRGTAPVAVIASFGGRVEATAQFHQNSRSCGAGRLATDTAVVNSTSTAKCRDPDQHGEGGDHAVSRILKLAHHPHPTRQPPGLRQTSAVERHARYPPNRTLRSWSGGRAPFTRAIL